MATSAHSRLGPLGLLEDIRLIAAISVMAVTGLYQLPSLPDPGWLVAPLALCLLRFPGRALVAVVLMVLAWSLIQAHGQMERRWPLADHGHMATVSGHVVGLPERQGHRSRFVLQTEQPRRRLRLSWYGRAPALQPGDALTVKAKLSTPTGSANPGGFDYPAWLWLNGIDGTGYVRQALDTDQPPRWSVDRMRYQALKRLAPALEGHAMRGVIEAVSLGVREHMTDEQWATFRETGTSHLMAISGLHVGLIAGWLFALARWLALRSPAARHAQSVAAVVGVVAAVGYAALAGWAVPTQRAVIMATVLFVTLAVNRRLGADRALAWAALAVVLWQPATVISPGFWLSFAAVAWLIWFAGEAGHGWWRQMLKFQLGLVMALMPLTLWFFGQGSWVAPVVNAILIPAASVVVPVILLAVGTAWVAPNGVGHWLLTRVADGLATAWPGLEWMAGWPLASFHLAVPGPLALGLAVLGTLLWAAPLPLRLRWLAMILVLPAVIGWRPADQQVPHGQFQVTALDVGHGLANVVMTQHHTLVYDAGPAWPGSFDAGAMVVVPYLRHIGRPQVDRLMISHADMDHIGGAEAIGQALSVRRRMGAESSMPCRAGQHWQWDGVTFEVLYPNEQDVTLAANRNDRSCVVRVQGAGGASLLLTGDLEAPGERRLVGRAGSRLASDVLVAPHHGSDTSSTQAFVAAVNPAAVLFSTGWQHRWRFPRPTVVARYRRRQTAMFNTATDGALHVRWSSQGDPEVRRWRDQRRRFWQRPRSGSVYH